LNGSDLAQYIDSYVVSPSPHTVTGLGIIGDSASEEYTTGSYTVSNNYPELLYNDTLPNFIPNTYSRKFARNNGPLLNGGTFGIWDPVRTIGFKYNCGLSGATTYSAFGKTFDGGVLANNRQDSIMKTLVTAGEVSHCIVSVGSNNWSPGNPNPPQTSGNGTTPLSVAPNVGAFESIYNGAWGSSEINAYNARYIADIRGMIDNIAAGGACKFILCGPFDYGNVLYSRVLYPDVNKRSLVSQAQYQANELLRLLAEEKQCVFFDSMGWCNDLWGTTLEEQESHLISGWLQNQNSYGVLSTDCSEDALHPGTLWHGLFANGMIYGLNAWGCSYTPFTDGEILANRGLAIGSGGPGLSATAADINYDPLYANSITAALMSRFNNDTDNDLVNLQDLIGDRLWVDYADGDTNLDYVVMSHPNTSLMENSSPRIEDHSVFFDAYSNDGFRVEIILDKLEKAFGEPYTLTMWQRGHVDTFFEGRQVEHEDRVFHGRLEINYRMQKTD